MLAASGASAVMIGRAAVGAPWLVGAIARALATGAPLAEPPRRATRREAALEHLELLLAGWARTPACAMRASIFPPMRRRPARPRRCAARW